MSWTDVLGDSLVEEGTNVIAISDNHERRLSAIERGYSEVFQANIPLDEIAARLYSRARERANGLEPPRETMAKGPLRVDVAQRIAYWHDQEVELTPRLFALAAYLAARPGVYVSIRTLLQEVWRESWANADKVHKGVSRLRGARWGRDLPRSLETSMVTTFTGRSLPS